jgi:hypothetical protein
MYPHQWHYNLLPNAQAGILPHDFVHYVVEDTLDLRQGFWRSALAFPIQNHLGMP